MTPPAKAAAKKAAAPAKKAAPPKAAPTAEPPAEGPAQPIPVTAPVMPTYDADTDAPPPFVAPAILTATDYDTGLLFHPSANVHQRIVAIIRDMPPLAKDQENTEQHFKFRGVDSVLDALNPLLAKHGVHYVPRTLEARFEERKSRGGNPIWVTKLHVQFTFYGIAGDSVISTTWGEGTDSGDKATPKGHTGAMKYCLFEALTIAVKEQSDADGDRTAPPEALPSDVAEMVARYEALPPDIRTATANRIAKQAGWMDDEANPWTIKEGISWPGVTHTPTWKKYITDLLDRAEAKAEADAARAAQDADAEAAAVDDATPGPAPAPRDATPAATPPDAPEDTTTPARATEADPAAATDAPADPPPANRGRKGSYECNECFEGPFDYKDDLEAHVAEKHAEPGVEEDGSAEDPGATDQTPSAATDDLSWIDALGGKDLQEALKAAELPRSGSVPELRERLRDYYTGNGASTADVEPEPEPEPEATAEPDTSEDEDVDPGEPDEIEDDGTKAPPETIQVIRDEAAKLRGAEARAFAQYRRKQRLPEAYEDYTFAQAIAMVEFIEALSSSDE
jgi:hypothetical protein